MRVSAPGWGGGGGREGGYVPRNRVCFFSGSQGILFDPFVTAFLVWLPNLYYLILRERPLNEHDFFKLDVRFKLFRNSGLKAVKRVNTRNASSSHVINSFVKYTAHAVASKMAYFVWVHFG